MLTNDLAPERLGYALVVALAAPHHPFASAAGLAVGLVAVVVALILLLPYTSGSLLKWVIIRIDTAVHGHALRHVARRNGLREGQRQGIAHIR